MGATWDWEHYSGCAGLCIQAMCAVETISGMCYCSFQWVYRELFHDFSLNVFSPSGFPNIWQLSCGTKMHHLGTLSSYIKYLNSNLAAPQKTGLNWFCTVSRLTKTDKDRSVLVQSSFSQSGNIWRLVSVSVLSNIGERPDRTGLSSTIPNCPRPFLGILVYSFYSWLFLLCPSSFLVHFQFIPGSFPCHS